MTDYGRIYDDIYVEDLLKDNKEIISLWYKGNLEFYFGSKGYMIQVRGLLPLTLYLPFVHNGIPVKVTQLYV